MGNSMRSRWLQSPSSRVAGRWILALYVALGGLAMVAAKRVTGGSYLDWLLGSAVFLLAAQRIRAAPLEPGLMEAILEGSPMAIFGVDREGRVRDHWNPAARKRFGMTGRKAQGQPMPVVLPGFEAEARRLVARAFQGEPITGIAAQGLPRRGESFPLNLSLTPVFGRDGQVARVLVIIGDDQVQRQRIARLAAALGERTDLLDAVRQAGIVLWALDPRSGRLTHVSSAAQEVLGVGRDRLLADPAALTGLLEAKDREPFRLAQAEALAGHVGCFEAPLEARRQGRRIWTRWTLDLSNGLVRGLIQDITEARELQEQLLHSQKLETVGEFLSTVTHDFNNILISILGYNELLLMDPQLSADQKRRLQAMQKGANRGHALASRLLRYARKGPEERRATDVNALVVEVIALLEEAPGPGIRYLAELDPDLPSISADAAEIHQVLMNLGVNARDAMPQGGTLTFRTSRLGGEAAAALGLPAGPGSYLRVEIRDTGLGIPAGLREKIFDPFFTTKAEGKGTGLGLAVASRIVKAHQGLILCTSEEGQGSVFQVLLPVSA